LLDEDPEKQFGVMQDVTTLSFMRVIAESSLLIFQ
jgi:hypothetical protein